MNAIWLKDFRKKYGLSQSDIANIVGCTIRTVQSWEQAYRNMPKSSVKLLENYENNLKYTSQSEIKVITVDKEKELYDSKEIKYFIPEGMPKQIGKLYIAPIYETYPVSAGKMGLAEVRDEKPNGYAYTTLPGVMFFPVIGCSFEPDIHAGEYIGVVKINSWERIDTEKIYFIITNEERMLKRLRLDDEDKNILWCVSPNFKEFKILANDIIEINHVFFHGKMV